MGEYGEAAGLINTLQNDPVFPGRLDPHLEEVMAYWFFKQEMYDSSMLHLQNTLPITIDLQDQARREFLLAQLNEMSGSLDTASSYYNAAIHHTVDPLMDIYANLNKAKMLKSTDPEEIDRSIQVLSRMARRDKYDLYRDIIYYAAAELAMEKPDTTQAISLYLGSIRYNESNVNYKNQAFYKLATLSYSLKDYKHAFAYYDSLQLEDTTLGDIEEIRKRKDALAKIVAHINVIEREDSLQLIARMSETERNDFIKKLSKQLRKERGIKDGDSTYFNSAAAYYDLRNPQPDIFSSSSNAQGEWYFYNTSLKSRGLGEFKRLWGKRPNADNWRRSSQGNALVNQTPAAELTDPAAGDPLAPPADNPLAKPAQNNIANFLVAERQVHI
jgi:tetratricopeptide (TPR) repeat protein